MNPIRPIALTTLLLLLPMAAAADKPLDTLADVPGHARLAVHRAALARDEGDTEKAVEILLQVLADKPEQDHYILRTELGNALQSLDRPESALPHFRRAVELEPRAAQAWLGLGQTAYDLQMYGEAAEALERGYRLMETPRPILLYYAGVSRLLAGEPGPSADLLEELLATDSTPPRLDWLRALISACGELEDAARGRRAVDRLLDLFADDPQAWLLAFRQAAAAEDYRRAAIALTVKSYLAPLTDEERNQLGDLYRLLDIPLLAGTQYELAMTEDADAKTCERLAATWLAAHETDQARAVLQRALAKSPSVKLWALLGDICYMQSDLDGAVEAFEACRQLDPEFGRAWLMLGACAMQQQRHDEARRLLAKARTFQDQQANADALLRQVSAESP